MAVLHDFRFGMALGYMTYGGSHDVYLQSPYELSISRRSNLALGSVYSTCDRRADGPPIRLYCTCFSRAFCTRDLNWLLNIQAWLHQWLSEHHQSEVSSSEGPLEGPDVGDFDAYMSLVKAKSGCDVSDLTGGTYLGDFASVCVHYDQLRVICLTTFLSLLMFVAAPIRLAVRCVSSFSDPPVIDTWIDALEATLESSNERTNTLELQVASNDAKDCFNACAGWWLRGLYLNSWRMDVVNVGGYSWEKPTNARGWADRTGS